MPTKTQPRVQFMKDGTLTSDGRAVIRALAANGLSTAAIRAEVPESVPLQSIIAFVAVARRKRPKNGKKAKK